MVNGPIHEWERDAGTEGGHESDAGGFRDAETLSSLARRRESRQELAEAIPEMRRIARQEPVLPSAAQWAAFSRSLSERLDREEQQSKWACWRASLRDRLSSTDSKTLRAGFIAAITTAVAALLAALMWLAAELAPVPAVETVSEKPASPPALIFRA